MPTSASRTRGGSRSCAGPATTSRTDGGSSTRTPHRWKSNRFHVHGAGVPPIRKAVRDGDQRGRSAPRGVARVTLVHAIGKAPLWPAVLLLVLAELLHIGGTASRAVTSRPPRPCERPVPAAIERAPPLPPSRRGDRAVSAPRRARSPFRQLPPLQKSVLLAMANYARDDGTSCRPAQTTLATWTSPQPRADQARGPRAQAARAHRRDAPPCAAPAGGVPARAPRASRRCRR